MFSGGFGFSIYRIMEEPSLKQFYYKCLNHFSEREKSILAPDCYDPECRIYARGKTHLLDPGMRKKRRSRDSTHSWAPGAQAFRPSFPAHSRIQGAADSKKTCFGWPFGSILGSWGTPFWALGAPWGMPGALFDLGWGKKWKEGLFFEPILG